MARQRNYLPVLGLLLGAGAIITYFTVVNKVVAPRVPWLRDYPVLNLSLVALALWISYAGARRPFAQPAHYRGRRFGPALATLNVAFAAFFLWYLFGYSSHLPSGANAPKIGTSAPDFTLTDHEGRPVQLASLRGHNILLTFYRGHW